ncbi:MAG: response regulator transcription factor [Polyangiaceae bacterium]|jgi:DNA-binding response OmpR family regulator
MLPSSNPVVLVADDEPSMLELVAQHLKTLDNPQLVVLEASDGEQAWKLAREHLPDLVVLDVMMPGMSGWEVCRKIREDVALAHTGVVMLTGIGENLNQMTSPLYGADAYIDKPFDFEELDEKVKAALLARAAQRDAVQRPTKNVNGVSGPAKAAKASRVSAKAKSASKTKTSKTSNTSNTNKKRSKSSSKTLAAAKAKAGLSSKSKPKPKKGETKMAAKKAKKAKKTAKKKTAKKKAK